MTTTPGRWLTRHSEALTLYRVARSARLWRALIDDLPSPHVFAVTGADGVVYRFRRLDPAVGPIIPEDPATWSELVWAAFDIAKGAMMPGVADGVVPDGLVDIVRVSGRRELQRSAIGRRTAVFAPWASPATLDTLPHGAVDAVVATYRAVGAAAARDAFDAALTGSVTRGGAPWV